MNIDSDRLKHSLAVARKMVEIGKNKELTEKELQELFVLGYNHDIGYEFVDNNLDHGIVGGEILKESNYKYWQEVYYHGNPNTKYESLYLTILNQADMQIDKYGNDVAYKKRLEDIKSRYGDKSIEYTNARTIIEKIKEEIK